MSEPEKTFNDGGIKFVRQLVTLKDKDGASTQYIVKTGSLKRPVNKVKSTNESGVENKIAGMAGIPEGSITLQFVNPTDKPPSQMQYATLKDSSGDNISIVVWDVGDKFGAAEEAMVDCDITEKQAA